MAVKHGEAERFYVELGAAVRARRTSAGLTQLQLAGMIGLSRGSVANIERGQQSVLLHQFAAIAAALRARPEELLPSLAPPPPPEEAPAPVLEFLSRLERRPALQARGRR
jgi:transcriptional regulator with XRE-family HTH domain